MKVCDEVLVEKVLNAATAVHSLLGPGLLESVYEQALMVELGLAEVYAQKQVPIPIKYRGHELGIGFRADVLVEECLLLELKSVEAINAMHLSQVITYLKLLEIKRGYIINFNVRLLKHGIKRISI